MIKTIYQFYNESIQNIQESKGTPLALVIGGTMAGMVYLIGIRSMSLLNKIIAESCTRAGYTSIASRITLPAMLTNSWVVLAVSITVITLTLFVNASKQAPKTSEFAIRVKDNDCIQPKLKSEEFDVEISGYNKNIPVKCLLNLPISEEMDEISRKKLHNLLTQHPFDPKHNCKISKSYVYCIQYESNKEKEFVKINNSIIKIDDEFYVIGNEYIDKKRKRTESKIKNISHIIKIEDGELKIIKPKEDNEKVVKITNFKTFGNLIDLKDKDNLLERESKIMKILNFPRLQSTKAVRQINIQKNNETDDEEDTSAKIVDYLVMSRLHGKMAREQSFEDFTILDRLDISIDLLEQMKILFNNNLVHRDLTYLNNLMYLEKHKRIQLFDFGSAERSDNDYDLTHQERNDDLSMIVSMIKKVFKECSSHKTEIQEIINILDVKNFNSKDSSKKPKEKLEQLMNQFTNFLAKLKNLRNQMTNLQVTEN